MDFDLLLRNFTRSLDLVNEGELEDFDLSIANAVLWACILDEALTERLGAAYEEARDADRKGRTLFALRLARNAIVHGQTFGLHDGHPFPPFGEPMFYGPRVWKSYDELTESWLPRGPNSPHQTALREVYEEEIAGTHIGAPVWAARAFLDALAADRWVVK